MLEAFAMKNSPARTVDFSRAHEYLKQMNELAASRAERRRAGRQFGEIGKNLSDSLRACNVAQLKKVKKLCDRFIEKHRHPPEEFECLENYIVKVLASVCIKNKRYQFEMRRGSFRRKTTYLNGPYLYAYWRDGRLIRKQYLKNGKGLVIPRRVKTVIKPFLAPERIKQETNASRTAQSTSDTSALTLPQHANWR
jgi:hypothetical protein